MLFGGGLKGLIITSIIYGTSITIALCPVGEIILRFLEGCRLPATEQEKSYLIPIFEEVYDNAKEMNLYINKDIKIYVMDGMYVNAFAIGRKTVAVTRGALGSFSRDELKGILAHELGHMYYGHTKALLLSVIGNVFFSIIVKVLGLLLYILEVIASTLAFVNWIGWIFKFMAFIARWTFYISVFLFVNAGELLLSFNSRTNEIQADKYAYTIGYGRELTSAMYLLQKISMNTKLKFSDKMKASHPHIAFRIEHLEQLENKKHEE